MFEKMIAIAPNSAVTFYAGVEITDGLEVAFSTPAKQQAYFSKRQSFQVVQETYNYHSKTSSMMISGTPARVMACNYLSFVNPAYEDVTFYARLIDFEMINNDTTQVTFQIDWYQTFMFSARYRSSMIEREHLSENDHQLSLENPHRLDIPELLTEEPDLPVSENFEVVYNHFSSGAINEDGLRDLGDGRTVVPNFGEIGLVTTLNYAAKNDATETDHVIVFQVADFKRDSTITQGFLGLFDEVRPVGWSQGFARSYMLCSIKPDNVEGNQDEWASRIKHVVDWFTGENLVHQILGIYVVPLGLLTSDPHYYTTAGSQVLRIDDTNSLVLPSSFMPTATIDVPAYSVPIDNPKLNRYPFRYIRAVSPNGDEKSFKLERFMDPTAPTFRMYGLFDDVPSVIVVPQSYNGYSIDFENRLVYSLFPQVGYVIDGYLSYIASKYQEAFANFTRGNKLARQTTGRAGAVLNGVGSVLNGMVSSALSGNLQMGDLVGGGSIADSTNNYDLMTEAQNVRGAGGLTMSQIASGDIPSAVLDPQRNAFPGGDYVGGNAAGSLAVRLGRDYFELIVVTLRPEILQRFDEYLTCYGYASNRYGVPRVCGFSQGTGETPHFASLDGYNFTYVKTRGLKVIAPIKVASDWIASLFDAGCRFLNGDEL